jgi:hypothetical protein
MSAEPGSSTAPPRKPGLNAGTSALASATSSSRVFAAMSASLRKSASAGVCCCVAKNNVERWLTSGVGVNQDGDSNRKAWLARVSARTGALP